MSKEFAELEQQISELLLKHNPFKQEYGAYWQEEYVTVATPNEIDYVTNPDPTAPCFRETKERLRFLVERMLDILDSDEKWCVRAAAMSADGKKVDPRSPMATKWCLAGAAIKACADSGIYKMPYGERPHGCGCSRCQNRFERMNGLSDALHDLMERAAHMKFGMQVPRFNDHPNTTFEDVRLFLKGLLDKL